MVDIDRACLHFIIKQFKSRLNEVFNHWFGMFVIIKELNNKQTCSGMIIIW
jgi:hypothetical protein